MKNSLLTRVCSSFGMNPSRDLPLSKNAEENGMPLGRTSDSYGVITEFSILKKVRLQRNCF